MRLLVVEDHLTPYRLPIYSRLAKRLDWLHVLYCSEPLRYERCEPPSLPFAARTLPHWVLRLGRPRFDEPRFLIVNPTLFAEVLRARPTVVVGYAFSIPAWTAYLAARLAGAAYVCWSTDTLFTERHLGPGQRLSRKLLIGAADAYIGPGRAACEKFARYGAPDDQTFSVPQRTLQDNLESLNDSQGDFRYLYVGSLIKRKGVNLLLDAFQSVTAELPQTELVIAGDGPLRSELERQARALGVRQQVDFMGFLQKEELAHEYRRAGAFVFPSLEDTYAVAIADAVAAGLPIIASEFAGATRDLVHEGVNGYSLDPNRTQVLAEAMLELARDQELRRKLAAWSADLGKKFTVKRAVDQFEAAVRVAESS